MINECVQGGIADTLTIINLTLKDYAEKIISYSRNVPDRNVYDGGVCTDAYSFWSR